MPEYEEDAYRGTQTGKAISDFLANFVSGRELKRRRKKDEEEKGLEALERDVREERTRQTLDYLRQSKEFATPSEPVPPENLLIPEDTFSPLALGARAVTRRQEESGQALLRNLSTPRDDAARIRAVLGKLSPEEETERQRKEQEEADNQILETIKAGLGAGADFRKAKDAARRIKTPAIQDQAFQNIREYAPKEEADSEYQKKLRFKVEAGIPEAEAKELLRKEAAGIKEEKPEEVLTPEEITELEGEITKLKEEDRQVVPFSERKKSFIARRRKIEARTPRAPADIEALSGNGRPTVASPEAVDEDKIKQRMDAVKRGDLSAFGGDFEQARIYFKANLPQNLYDPFYNKWLKRLPRKK